MKKVFLFGFLMAGCFFQEGNAICLLNASKCTSQEYAKNYLKNKECRDIAKCKGTYVAAEWENAKAEIKREYESEIIREMEKWTRPASQKQEKRIDSYQPNSSPCQRARKEIISKANSGAVGRSYLDQDFDTEPYAICTTRAFEDFALVGRQANVNQLEERKRVKEICFPPECNAAYQNMEKQRLEMYEHQAKLETDKLSDQIVL